MFYHPKNPGALLLAFNVLYGHYMSKDSSLRNTYQTIQSFKPFNYSGTLVIKLFQNLNSYCNTTSQYILSIHRLFWHDKMENRSTNIFMRALFFLVSFFLHFHCIPFLWACRSLCEPRKLVHSLVCPITHSFLDGF